jgi:hypothetical protein
LARGRVRRWWLVLMTIRSTEERDSGCLVELGVVGGMAPAPEARDVRTPDSPSLCAAPGGHPPGAYICRSPKSPFDPMPGSGTRFGWRWYSVRDERVVVPAGFEKGCLPRPTWCAMLRRSLGRCRWELHRGLRWRSYGQSEGSQCRVGIRRRVGMSAHGWLLA